MKKSELIKNISLGLIYPAVLGSMIYMLFQFLSNVSLFEQSSDGSFKLYILIVTIIIYLIDYIKRFLNQEYKFWMLIFDILIVINLFYIVQVAKISHSINLPIEYKEFFLIGICFFIHAGYNNITLIISVITDKGKDTENNSIFQKEMFLNFIMFAAGGFLAFSVSWNLFSYNSWKVVFVVISSIIVLSEVWSLFINIKHKTIS